MFEHVEVSRQYSVQYYMYRIKIGSAGTAVRDFFRHRRVSTTVQYVVGVQVTRDEPHDGVMCLVEPTTTSPNCLCTVTLLIEANNVSFSQLEGQNYVLQVTADMNLWRVAKRFLGQVVALRWSS